MFVEGGDAGDEALLIRGMVVVVVLGIEVLGFIVGDDVEFPIPDGLLGEVVGAFDCRTPAEKLLGDVVNCAGRGSVV